MLFNSIMHVAFHTKQFDEMMDFYVNKMGLELKVLVRYGSYLNRTDRPAMQKIAKEDPNRIFNAYIEIAEGQFIELFPSADEQKAHPEWNAYAGYTHFALLVDDIYKVREELEAKGLIFDSAISKGPSETYQMWMHDPDGNRFEIMQYTDKSIQLTGQIDSEGDYEN